MGAISIDGITLDDGAAARAVLRNNVGMVFQQFNLFPHLSILENLTLGPVRARGLDPQKARELAEYYLERVRIPEQIDKYPHQLSGGQQQRVAIARALVNDPKLVIADEPVTALDVIVQRDILQRIQALQKRDRFSVILITHDLPLMLRFADRVAIMKDGEIVEQGPARTLQADATHPYTQRLLRSFPSTLGDREDLRT